MHKSLRLPLKQEHPQDVSPQNCACCCSIAATTGTTTATGSLGITGVTTAVLLKVTPEVNQYSPLAVNIK